MFSVIRRNFSKICMRIDECVQIKSLTNNALPVTYLNGHNFQSLRYKSKKSQKPTKNESSTETSGEEEPDPIDSHTKIVRTTVPSLRTDLLLKAGMGIARNKVETLFYDSKIRVNGQKLLKKSGEVREGDEIDIVKGPVGGNTDLLSVARVEVLSVSEKGDSYVVKLRRSKDLTIANYDNKL